MIFAVSALFNLCSFFFRSSAAINAIPPQLNVVPYPSNVELGPGALQIEPSFNIIVTECYADCEILRRAISRYVFFLLYIYIALLFYSYIYRSRYLTIILEPPGSTGTVFRLSIFENRINQSMPVGLAGKLNRLNVLVTNKVQTCIIVHSAVLFISFLS